MKRIISIIRHLRLTPFDISTPNGRDSERYRLAALAIATNVASKAANLLLMVLSVKLTIPYLGQERFGIWATFASLTAMLSFLDLGVGNAIVNRVAHAATDKDHGRLRQAVTGGTGVLALFGLGSTSLLIVISSVLPWRDVFRLTSEKHADEAFVAATVFGIVFGVNVLSTGLLKALAGQQRSFEANIISATLAILACAALIVASNAKIGVPWLIVSTLGVQTSAGLFAMGLLHKRGLLNFSSIVHSTRIECPRLLRSGLLFLVLQIGTMVGWGSDSLILASQLGAEQVAVYAVAQRLFQFASLPIMMLNSPLWAAYADASARNDCAFIGRTLRTSLKASLLLSLLLSFIVLAASPVLVSWWTGSIVAIPVATLCAFALWTVIESVGNAFAMYLNGCGIVRQQVAVVMAFCIVALPLKILLTQELGVTGLLVATITAYLLVVVGLYGTLYRHDVRRPYSTGGLHSIKETGA